MSELKKGGYDAQTLGGFIAIFILFIGSILFGISQVGDISNATIIYRIMYIDSALLLILMALIIRAKDSIHWISSYSYEDVKKMSPKKKKMISTSLLVTFGSSMTALIVYMIIAMFLGTSMFLDMMVFTVLILVAVFWMLSAQSKINDKK